MARNNICTLNTGYTGKLGLYPFNKRSAQIFLLLLPGVTVITMFTIYPIVKMFVMSFFDWKMGLGQISNFILFENYKEVFTDTIFGVVMTNTFLYALPL